jgi:hypothetical protein
MEDLEYKLIEKENIASLHFPQEDILKSVKLQLERKSTVERAISLGNLEHQKVKIYFSDDAGKKRVDTTIWAVTDTSIVLKQNVILPINRIHKLEI